MHSPFVYDYVTKCLYKKNKLRLPITEKVLIKSISYFDYKTVRLLVNNEDIAQKIKTNCPTVSLINNNSDVIFGNINDLQSSDLEIHKLKSITMLVVDGIHKNKNTLERWERLKELDCVRVTVDIFYCGVVFFRKEQVKEHFKIRI
ncbi:hypothetical protein [Maribacter sp. ACAM166]|uniref:hypothetical protein n=1 Tax=Maribacter sp. ACAM166 TaxID=2508996 RepID=UPI0010FCF22B|nr:hypothetical protein [Maribacter sp. ACAM166]TLP76743.1 hypothetical protein ES765_14075 [Maribacter sp. ACAM166]